MNQLLKSQKHACKAHSCQVCICNPWGIWKPSFIQGITMWSESGFQQSQGYRIQVEPIQSGSHFSEDQSRRDVGSQRHRHLWPANHGSTCTCSCT